MQRTYLCYPHRRDPSLERALVVGAQELYEFYTLWLLQSRVLDREAEVRRRLVLLLPVQAYVHLVRVKSRQAHQLLQCLHLVFRRVVQP